MDEQPTCGKGLAENSALPSLLADVTGGMVDVLEAHMRALDTGD